MKEKIIVQHDRRLFDKQLRHRLSFGLYDKVQRKTNLKYLLHAVSKM